MTLIGRLEVDASIDAVAFVFEVENAGAAAVDLEFRSGKTADVVVYEVENEVWRWSDGRMFTQALRSETVEPGETLTHRMVWEQPPTGTYTAEASLAASNAELIERATFTVRPAEP